MSKLFVCFAIRAAMGLEVSEQCVGFFHEWMFHSCIHTCADAVSGCFYCACMQALSISFYWYMLELIGEYS